MNKYNDKGEKHGEWERPIGELFIHIGPYVNDKRHGFWKSIYSFSKELSWTGYYNNNQSVGFWCDYYNGRLDNTTFFL